MESIINVFNSSSDNPLQKSSVKLIGQGDDAEVIKYEIPEKSLFVINPADHPEAYEFYYILKGELKREGEILSENDCLEIYNLKNSITYKASQDTLILLFVSRGGEYDISLNFHRHYIKQMETIENKDHYTYQHSRRVKRLVYHMGVAMSLTGDEIRDLTIAANFHDIGKIKIQDHILNKKIDLVGEEIEHMKKHVEYSVEILHEKMAESISDIIILHHEKLDGSGYPRGLSGEEISISGRILAVADAYDAMTTDRVYKKGKSSIESIEELFSLKEQYDVKIVQILKDVIGRD